MISIHEVGEQNLSDACNVMREAAEWLNQKGMPLWRDEQLSPAAMRPFALRGQLYVATVHDEPAGTIIVQDDDPAYWPEVTDGQSLFFHKLTVRRKFAGQGISRALMDHAFKLAQARGKSFLRMDCSAHHLPLRGIYEANGFQFLDQKTVDGLLVDRLFKAVLTVADL